MPLWRLLGLVVVAVAAICAVVIWAFPPNDDFHPQSRSWNGSSQFVQRHRAAPVGSLADLPRLDGGTVLFVIPYRRPASVDLQQLQVYVEGGGTLVLADDFGFGNSVLEELHLPYRFHGSLLRDPVFHSKGSAFPLATAVTGSSFTEGVAALALNYPTALEGEGMTAVVHSSSFSFLDLNADGERQETEPSGPLPIVAYVKVGKGRLILISDPSIIINSMLGLEGNQQLLSNLVASAGLSPRVYLAQSPLPHGTLVRAKGVLAAAQDIGKRPGIFALFVIAAVVSFLSPYWNRRGQKH